MAKKTARNARSDNGNGGADPPRSKMNGEDLPGERELIVIAHPDASLRSTPTGLSSATGVDVTSLSEMLEKEKVALKPLFGIGEERLQRQAAAATEQGDEMMDLSPFYRLDAPDERLDELCECLADNDLVEAAFVKPPTQPAMLQMDIAPVSEEAPPATPNFVSRQGYLNAAPVGVDAKYAWTRPGGRGDGVRIIDIEGAWNFTHEDLLQNQGGVVGGSPTTNLGWRNHGTAVVGEIGGDENNIGVTGICPRAITMGVSIFGGLGSAAAIRHAADRLNPGDIILIELHRPGPRHNFQSPNGQRGYIAIEWWPDDYAAIRYAANKGVIVIEAAGNGAENLADAIYDSGPSAPFGSFPSWWRNPFQRSPLDSGAIIVGAGAPPPGTHGRSHGPDRSRLDFSNYGPNVDTQGWGREVTTTGYGNLQGGTNENEWYTDTFSGTSSASPIVVGTVGCLQGTLRAAGRSLLNPTQTRTLLRGTGSPQTDGPGRPRTQRIGNRPDLRQLIARTRGTGRRTVPLYRYWNRRISDHFYTTNWRELGRGRHGWRYEGIQCYVDPQRRRGLLPLYRYWNPRIGDHFYTTNWRELGGGRYGWRYESMQCWVSRGRATGTVALLRYWNPRIGDHFYTTSWRELGFGRNGYRLEGIAGYVYPRATVPVPPTVSAPPTEEVIAVAGEAEEAFESIGEMAPGEMPALTQEVFESFETAAPEFMMTGPLETEPVDMPEEDAAPESFEAPSLFSESMPDSFELATDAENGLSVAAPSFLSEETEVNGGDANGREKSFRLHERDQDHEHETNGHPSNVGITINIEGEHQRPLVTTS